ncbi:MAG: hypothetical protein ACI9FR_002648 [Cryomorphaceae bacterium]
MAASAVSQQTFLRAYKAGVNIAFGAASAVTPQGDNADEFVIMVDAGMSAFEAIRSATVVSAKLFGVEGELATLENGKLADLVAVSANPLDDIPILREVDFLMKARKMMRPANVAMACVLSNLFRAGIVCMGEARLNSILLQKSLIAVNEIFFSYRRSQTQLRYKNYAKQKHQFTPGLFSTNIDYVRIERCKRFIC